MADTGFDTKTLEALARDLRGLRTTTTPLTRGDPLTGAGTHSLGALLTLMAQRQST